MRIDWNVVGICAAVVFCGLLLLKPLGCGFERLKSLPRELLVLFLSFAIIAAVEADKTNSTTRALMRQLVGLPAMVTQEEIARGYRLGYVTNDAGHSFAMPTNAVYLGNAHIRGAASGFGRNRLDFGEWSFPFGSNDTSYSSIWWFHDGRIRMSPRDPSGEISSGASNVVAVQGESRIWWAPGDGDERIVGWENVFPNADTNDSVNLQIVLRRGGDFETWLNDAANVYMRIDPNDWDGDGLDNTIDPEPTVYGGDCFGTGIDWLNANCGAVLSASAGINGEPVVAWHTNVCAAAYYWLEFSALSDATRITIDCEGEINLGDMVVIANSNQVCRVPLLMGPRYHVAANGPLSDVATSDAAAEITTSVPLRRGGAAQGSDFYVQRQVELGFTGTAPNLVLYTLPYVGASISCFTGGCCQAVFDGVSLTWTCGPNCSCGGFSHVGLDAAATWEGYTQSFLWEQGCECQEYNKEHPEAWLGMSVSSVVMLHGDMGVLSVGYSPCGEPSGTVTLRCTAGSGKVALWADTNKTHSVTLPMAWSAAIQSGTTIFVEGEELSESVGDVVFECELALQGDDARAVTRSMTVARVKQMNVSSAVAGVSTNPPPFLSGVDYPFSATNSPLPDKHLVVPFENVATLGTNGFSVADFHVDMALELEPAGVSTSGLSASWSVVEATPQMSGALVGLGGLSARFVNPKLGGVYRFKAEAAGSSNTYATVVLPLAGAEVSGVFEADFALYAAAMSNLNARTGRFERQTPSFGRKWFNNGGAADYLGRVDNVSHPTVWFYNQVNDISGMGAVASFYGVPMRMAKLGNFLAGYGTEFLGVWGVSQWLSQGIGTSNDETASMSWDAGTLVASGTGVVTAASTLSTNMWDHADVKVRRLWPNHVPTDNHAVFSSSFDFNRNFCSPGVVEGRVR